VAVGGFVAYLALAVAAHIRKYDERDRPTPIILLALSGAGLILGIAAG
jgi:hypothetical protein